MSVLPRRDNPGGERGRPIRTGRADRPVIHLPSVALRVAFLGVLTAVLVGVVIFRLWFLQILSGQQYTAQANDNRLRSVKVVAPRGTILDRNGGILVDNRPGLAVGIRPMDVPAGGLDDLVRRLGRVLGVRAAKIRQQLEEHTGVSFAELDRDSEAGGFDLVVEEDTTRTVVSYLLEHKQSFPGVEVRKNSLRHYPQGDLAAHLTGNLGEITRDQLKEPEFRHYAAGDVMGQSGVEYTYDRWLRGVDGSLRVEVDALGRPKRVVAGGKLPEPGGNLVLSLDSRVQRATEHAVRYGIDLAHVNDAPRANAGAAVVLDVRTGEVIAMASYPSFDPEWWVGGISERHMRQLTRRSANTPLLNRADQGEYAIGSTFKVVDAVAGLQEGVIDPYKTFTCQGSYKPPHSRDKAVWHCWTYPLGHGVVNLQRALTESCDVYFYNVGMEFYSRPGTPLEDWATRLGFGKPTGLDIPGEHAGRVPTPKWRREYFKNPVDQVWSPGNSINLAIGQGDFLATPLQVAVVYSAIANGGYVVRPHLGLRIVDAHGDLVQRIDHPEPKKLDIAPQTLELVRQGLRSAASEPNGTSSAVFGHYPVAVAGKTGTSQVATKGDYAWYASYAPADHPQYAVVVVIEQGGHGGTVAAPAARMIYDALFHLKSGRPTGTTHSD